MFSDKKNVLQLVALLQAHGVKRVVLCPGSRNIPLVQTFTACGTFECYSVTDERSAGFFAIGLAAQCRSAVAVCCTSGSALLNLHPAVSEAFYRRIPLIVISADRPEAWIGQMDGQTLPQSGVFGALVRKAVNLPEIHTDEDEWYCNRLVNEVLLETHHHGFGPIHINVPLSEPLFNFTVSHLPVVRCIVRRDLSENMLGDMQEELSRFSRCLVISGQMNPEEADAIAACLPADRFAWLTETLGNRSKGTVRGFDTVLQGCSEEDLALLCPDLVITFGGHIVSKRLKRFLRQNKPKAHWHITPDGMPVDLFCALTTVVETSPGKFWQTVSTMSLPASGYPECWQRVCKRYSDSAPLEYSEIYAVKKILEALPEGSVLHLGNSSVVRLAELFPLTERVEVQCNRGVNGIEGSMSAAVGFAAADDRLNLLLIGDLSFFYDMNALWNAYLRPNFRIVVLNNGGGAIFHGLPGLKMQDDTNRFVTAEHQTTAEGWACSQGLVYRKATDADDLQAGLKTLLAASAEAPVLLEIFTDAKKDAEELRKYYAQLKR